MIDIISFYVGRIFMYCWYWFRQILSATGATGFYLAGLIVFFVVTMILIPLRGGRVGGLGSDLAAVVRHSKSRDKGKGD